MKDIDSSYSVVKALTPSSSSDTTALTGSIVDLASAGAVEIALSSGTLTDADATFTVVLQEGAASNLSDAATVAAGDIIGSVPAPAFGDDDTVWKFGYKGSKRYIRLVVTPVGNTAAATFSAVAIIEKKKS
jgi:HAMP domain-containing protein